MAYMQRDLLAIQKNVADLSEILWGASVAREPNEESPTKNIHDKLSDVGLLLLQFSGMMGLDLVSILKARIEKEELSLV